ncbi:hypothetical protein BDQ17DRAFT_1321270 [Cyathus striatus]|nr:hypothetical protein BDQ17DRAFT_1321270 [Cyathus striatus]
MACTCTTSVDDEEQEDTDNSDSQPALKQKVASKGKGAKKCPKGSSKSACNPSKNKGKDQQLQEIDDMDSDELQALQEYLQHQRDQSASEPDIDPADGNLPESEDDSDVICLSYHFSTHPSYFNSLHCLKIGSQQFPSCCNSTVMGCFLKRLITTTIIQSQQPTPRRPSSPSVGQTDITVPPDISGPPLLEPLQSGQNSQPAVCDYSLDAKCTIQTAIDEYEVQISTVDTFPSEKKSYEWMQDIWDRIMMSEKEKLDRMVVAFRVMLSQMYGPWFKPHYGFSSTGSVLATSSNCQLCQMLLAKSAFHYWHPKKYKGYCQHTIVLNVLHETWYSNRNADGITYDGYFNPLPLPCLALIFTAVHLTFSEKVVEMKYCAHLKDLETWSDLNPLITKKICKKFSESAHQSTGVTNEALEEPQLIGDLLDQAQKELEVRTGDSDVEDESGPV